MNLLETVNKDVIAAMKAKEKERLEALRYLKSLLVQNNTELKPKDEMDILIGHVKKLKDSIEMYAGEPAAQIKIQSEIDVLNIYMPKQMTENEVEQLIKGIVSTLGQANIGQVMKELTPQIKGRFDGKKASDLVKKILG